MYSPVAIFFSFKENYEDMPVQAQKAQPRVNQAPVQVHQIAQRRKRPKRLRGKQNRRRDRVLVII